MQAHTITIFTPQPKLVRLIHNQPYSIALQPTDTLETVAKFHDLPDEKWVRYAKLEKTINRLEIEQSDC